MHKLATRSQAEKFSYLEEAARLILDQPENEVWFVATGPLTTTAALLQAYPVLVTHLRGLSFMGGAVGGGFTDAPLGNVKGKTSTRFGNWTPFAEF